VAGIVQSVQRLATGCTVWGLAPLGKRFSGYIQTCFDAYPAACKMSTVFLSWKESGSGMLMTVHTLLERSVNFYLPSVPAWHVRGHAFFLIFTYS